MYIYLELIKDTFFEAGSLKSILSELWLDHISDTQLTEIYQSILQMIKISKDYKLSSFEQLQKQKKQLLLKAEQDEYDHLGDIDSLLEQI